jgi:hypothetical protein
MTKQLTDRELINALSSAACVTGSNFTRWINNGAPVRSIGDITAIRQRSSLENEAVERLITRAVKIQRLQDEVADLKRELAALR